jgi:hypothetical protein
MWGMMAIKKVVIFCKNKYTVAARKMVGAVKCEYVFDVHKCKASTVND